MKKIQCFLVTIALIMSLSGVSLLQGMGMSSLANAASSRQASAQHVTTAFHIKPNVPCPSGGASDC